MASQRVTIAKIGGIAADFALMRLRAWAEARNTDDPDEWGVDQWPADIRLQVDDFAERLRANAVRPPVVYFVEWSDPWSMGDIYTRWLTPPGSRGPLQIYGNRFQVFAYALPDRGRLDRYLARAGGQWADEYDLYVVRLREAVKSWKSLVDGGVIIVLREVLGGLVTDEELAESLADLPEGRKSTSEHSSKQ